MGVAALLVAGAGSATAWARNDQDGANAEGTRFLAVLTLPTSSVREFPAATHIWTTPLVKAEALVAIDNGPTQTSRRVFHVLFGGHPATTTTRAKASLSDDGDDNIGNGVEKPVWVMETDTINPHGYAVARGWYPIIKTNVVRAVSQGSTMLAQVVPANDGSISDGLETHRILLIEGGPVDIHDLAGGQKATLNQEGQYIEAKRHADSTITWSTVKSLHGEMTADAAQFRKYVNILFQRPAALELMKIPD
jgi:hypothetical protein